MFKSTPSDFQIISVYLTDTLRAVKSLYDNELYGQALIVMVSAIDSFGLLNAPCSEVKSSGRMFKAWVNEYMLSNQEIEYTADDLWGYRCSLLHTYTTSSEASKSGKVREILFYSGNQRSPKVDELEAFATNLQKYEYVAANVEKTIVTFAEACRRFSRALDSKCRSSKEVINRVSRIVHKAQTVNSDKPIR